jgi:ribosomal protein S16
LPPDRLRALHRRRRLLRSRSGTRRRRVHKIVLLHVVEDRESAQVFEDLGAYDQEDEATTPERPSQARNTTR